MIKLLQLINKVVLIMAQEILHKQPDFNFLIQAISNLNFEQKRQIWELLDQEMIGKEEEEKDVLEAKKAYEKGGYLTLEDYISQRKNNDL